MKMNDEMIKLLAQQSIRDGEQRYTEDHIRDLVGAPSIEEESTCICGKSLDEFDTDCYEHMSRGY
jgi:hypothetical protein